MRFIKAERSPIGGWRYIHPTTEYRILGKSKEDLLTKVTDYAIANLLWVPKWSDIEEWLCSGKDLDPIGRAIMQRDYCCNVGNVNRNARDYIQGGISLVKGIGKYVSRVEAEKRAAICAKCPFNQRPENVDRIRSFTDKLAEMVVHKLATTQDDKLFNCSVCSCNLRVKVHYPQNIVTDSLSEKVYNKLSETIYSKVDRSEFKCWQVYGTEEKDNQE
jgi:hypothetical protein